MPYIDQEQRAKLGPEICRLVTKILELPAVSSGVLNYVITEILNRCYPTTRYRGINEVMGILECIKLEFYRRRAAPYENHKAEENGDIAAYARARAMEECRRKHQEEQTDGH